MGWLRKLLGLTGSDAPPMQPHAQPDAATTERRVTIKRFGEHIVSAREIDFTGQCATSANGRFTLLWRDRAYINGECRAGRYVLLDDGHVVVDRRMDRPQDGKVANDGVFILNDWGSADELAGTFHSFSAGGMEIVSRRFTANLLNNGLSDDGRLAVCQTCNAPGSPDSSILCVFDIQGRREIASWSPESGWADAYEFPTNGDRVRMLRRDREPIDYSLHGEFIDRHKWYADEVARGTYHIIRDALKAGEAVAGQTLEQLRAGAKLAIVDADDRFRAEALRLLGEIEERAGDEQAALEAFDRALAINPKIGVAKRAAALKKKLGA